MTLKLRMAFPGALITFWNVVGGGFDTGTSALADDIVSWRGGLRGLPGEEEDNGGGK